MCKKIQELGLFIDFPLTGEIVECSIEIFCDISGHHQVIDKIQNDREAEKFADLRIDGVHRKIGDTCIVDFA